VEKGEEPGDLQPKSKNVCMKKWGMGGAKGRKRLLGGARPIGEGKSNIPTRMGGKPSKDVKGGDRVEKLGEIAVRK